jgi:N-acetylglucosamine-6-sulfatase
MRANRLIGLRLLEIAIGLLVATVALAAQPQTSQPAAGPRPNFIFILIDDLRYDAMSCAGHPFVQTPGIDRIAANGVRFTNAFVTTSLCSPSRASFLTGMYVQSHGVRTNEGDELDPKWPTFPRVLRQNGYETAYIGKWHMGPSSQPRPGFDYWFSFRGQGVYIDPEFNENGREFQAHGYITDLLTDQAVKWIGQPRTKPFCLYLAHKAVHDNWVPAERHANLYADAKVPEPASYKDDLSSKPQWQRVQQIRGSRFKNPAPPTIPDRLPPGPWQQRDSQHKRILNYFRTLAAVDDCVARLLDTLERTGQLNNTVVIFAGDNGFFMGEHGGMGDKRLAYDESMRIPLVACGPGVPRGKLVDGMVLNIDLAPTLLDIAGAPIPPTVEGRSFKPLLDDPTAKGRDAFLYEYYREDWLPGIPTMLGVRTKDWKYVRYPEIKDIDELYDLRADPIEIHNLAATPPAAEQVKRMSAELDRLSREIGRHP